MLKSCLWGYKRACPELLPAGFYQALNMDNLISFTNDIPINDAP